MRLLNASDGGAASTAWPGRFEVSAGVANLRRLVVDTPRATWIGGGYLSRCATRAGSSSSRPRRAIRQGVPLATPLRLKGGTGRAVSGALEPGLGKLLIGAGAVPSLTGTYNQIAKQQPNVNACALMAPRVDGMRPGLRAQLPTPSNPERERNRRAQGACAVALGGPFRPRAAACKAFRR